MAIINKLPTNYKDAAWNGNKKYYINNNADGTVSIEDVTEYTVREESFFGAKQANDIGNAYNEVIGAIWVDLPTFVIPADGLTKMDESEVPNADFLYAYRIENEHLTEKAEVQVEVDQATNDLGILSMDNYCGDGYALLYFSEQLSSPFRIVRFRMRNVNDLDTISTYNEGAVNLAKIYAGQAKESADKLNEFTDQDITDITLSADSFIESEYGYTSTYENDVFTSSKFASVEYAENKIAKSVIYKAETVDGAIKFYAKTKPSEDVVINRISFRDIAFNADVPTLESIRQMIKGICPFAIGDVLYTMNDVNPSNRWIEQTTWKRIAQGRTLIGASDSYSVGSEGGEASHALTESEMPKHHHTIKWNGYEESSHPVTITYSSGSNRVLDITSYAWGDSSAKGNLFGADVGGSQSHNNMQPYLVTYIWQRIA